MVTDKLPALATTPDIETLVFKFKSDLPPTLADYATILRCYLREICNAFVDFLMICDEGFIKDAALDLLPKGTTLYADIHGTGVSLGVSQPQPPLVQFFIAQIGAGNAAIVGLTYANGHAALEMWGEVAFFETMEGSDISAYQSLWMVHDALCRRTAKKQSDEVARLAPRLEQLGIAVGQAFNKRGIPWNTHA